VFFRQVLHEDLGCASYLVADGGEAAVIDPKWDVEDYLALADEHGFRIAHVFETHNRVHQEVRCISYPMRIKIFSKMPLTFR